MRSLVYPRIFKCWVRNTFLNIQSWRHHCDYNHITLCILGQHISIPLYIITCVDFKILKFRNNARTLFLLDAVRGSGLKYLVLSFREVGRDGFLSPMLWTINWTLKKSPLVESSTWPLNSHNCSKTDTNTETRQRSRKWCGADDDKAWIS